MGSVTHQYGISSDAYTELVSHIVESFILIEACQYLPQCYEEEVEFKKVDFVWKTSKQKIIIFDLDETLIHCTLNDED